MLLGLCLGILAAPQAARADGTDCVLVVQGDGLRGRWARALAEVQRTLADRDDVDRCVELIVTAEARGLRVVVRLPAGGDATRLVDSPDDLAPTILALLLVPARPAAPVSVVETPPAPAELPRFMAPATPEPIAGGGLRVVSAAPSPAASTRFEIGIAMAARWQPRMALGAGGFADVALGRWLVGASGQWSSETGDQVIPTGRLAATGPASAQFTARSLEIGIELGRRFALGPVELTALLGPRLASVSRRYKVLPEPVTLVNLTTGESTMLRFDALDTRVTRLGGGVRAHWRGSKRLQLVLGVDAIADVAVSGGDLVRISNDGVAFVGPPPRSEWGFALTLGGLFRVSP